MKYIMKTNVLTAAFLLAFSLGTIHVVNAQCTDYKWPEDGVAKAKAEESLVLLKDNRTSNPKQAVPPLNWLITNTPELNKSVYIYGAEVFDALAKAEKNAAKQAKYVDSLLLMYDLRIKNTPCGEEASIVNRKALAAYVYFINTDKAKDLLKIMDKAFEMNGNDVMDGTLVPYMQTILVNKAKFNLTDEEIINRYEKISDIISAKIKEANAAGKPTDRYKQYQQQIDDIFIKTGVKVDCDLVKKNMEPKYRANPNDIDLAKKIFAMMLSGKCTDDPLWLETGEALIKDDIKQGRKPDYAIVKNLAIKYLAQENYTKAEEFLKIAVNAAETAADKADMLVYLGSLEAKKGNKVAARDYFRQALSADSGKKEAYEKIGDLYMNSFNECAEKENMADDRKVYLIAFDYYQKAGEGKKMSQAKEAFPSKEELFLKNYQVGTATKVNCWINESTTWRTRD